jgi:hypothetical protein
MNNRTAKKIRKIVPPDNAIARRNYRRAKKVYTKLSADARPIFLDQLKKIMESD